MGRMLKVLAMLFMRLRWARKKHPMSEWQGKDLVWAVDRMHAEADEAVQAAASEGEERTRSEVADTLVVAWRILMGDNARG